MKHNVLKKSLLDYAIKGNLSYRFRESLNANALDEIAAYNAQIRTQKATIEKQLKEIESKHKQEKAKEAKQILNDKLKSLKKELSKLKEITPLDSDFTPPFAIPPTWVWVKLGDICEISDGTHKTPKYLDNGIPFLSVKNISNGFFDLSDIKYISECEHLQLIERCKPKKNDVLICRIGTLGKAIKVDLDFEFSIFVSLGLLQPKLQISSDYLVNFLNSASMDKWIQANKVGGGTHAAKLNLNTLQNCFIPLPPLQEQEYIAKKLDSLVALANQFQEIKENLKRIEKRIEKSLLKYALEGHLSKLYRMRLASPTSIDEITAYNAQIRTQKAVIEKQLKEIEKLLKQKNISLPLNMIKGDCHSEGFSLKNLQESKKDISATPQYDKEGGKLTHKEAKQILNDKLKALKKELSKLKEITPLDSDFTPPFAIPPTWVWVKLGDICEIVSGGTPSRDKIEYWHNGTIPWVKIADVKNNVVNQTQEFITELGLENSSAKIFKKGTLLYTIFATLGETAILDIDATTNQAIVALIETYDYDTKFLMYYLMSVKDYVNNLGRGVAQNNINQTMLKNFPIPLPPLQEQEYIAKKLEELFIIARGLRVE